MSDLKVTTIKPGEYGIAVSGKANPDGSLYNPKHEKKAYSSAKLYNSLFVRHWDSYVEPQKIAIWYGLLQASPLTATAANLLSADRSTPKRLSLSGLTNLMAVSGLNNVESPIPPFGGGDHFDISANAIVFVAKDPELVPATHTTCICYYCPMFSWTGISGSNEKSGPRLYKHSSLQGAMTSPRLTSDGSSIVFLAMKEDGYEADKNRIIYVSNPWNGEMTEIFESSDGEGSWDLSPSSVQFHDDTSLLITVEEAGRGVLYHLPLIDYRKVKIDSLRKLTNSGSINEVVPLGSDFSRLFISGSSFVDNSIYTILDLGRPDDVTVVSSASRCGTLLGLSSTQVDEIWFNGHNGHPVHAWVIKPSFFQPNQRYPLAYLIHGGPQSAWSDAWSTRWNPAVFAEQGYVVVTPNPTGSTGYGQPFTDAIRGNWGGSPYIDIEKGFEYIAENLEYVDTDRAVALGASYGGYMMNWIQGHPLGRKFRALVTHDGVFNLVSQLASEEQYFPIHDLKGPFWKVPEEWDKWDPSRHTQHWNTPHLIIHNELDYRLPIAEGLAAFNVLQMRGVESQFLTFPDENHWVLKPENSLVWHHTVLNWINKFVGLPPSSLDNEKKVLGQRTPIPLR